MSNNEENDLNRLNPLNAGREAASQPRREEKPLALREKNGRGEPEIMPIAESPSRAKQPVSPSTANPDSKSQQADNAPAQSAEARPQAPTNAREPQPRQSRSCGTAGNHCEVDRPMMSSMTETRDRWAEGTRERAAGPEKRSASTRHQESRRKLLLPAIAALLLVVLWL